MLIKRAIKLIINNPKRVCQKIYESIFIHLGFYLHGKELSTSQKNRINEWHFYLFLKTKYKRYIKNLEEYQLPSILEKPKIIWWSWLQGEAKAPLICKACLASLRKFYPDYDIKILTEENMWNYITIPDYIKTKYENGVISRTHFSDILRTCLLVEHGGIWIDSTVLCTERFKYDEFEIPLFFYQNYDRGADSIVGSSWLLSSCKNHPILLTTRDLLFRYWEKSNYLIYYFLFHLFFTMAWNKYSDLAQHVPLSSNLPPHVLQHEWLNEFNKLRWNQIKDQSKFHKISWKLSSDINIKGTFLENILNEFLIDSYSK